MSETNIILWALGVMFLLLLYILKNIDTTRSELNRRIDDLYQLLLATNKEKEQSNK